MPILNKIVIVSIIFLFFTQISLAIENPRSRSTDKRIKVVAFHHEDVVPVYASTFITTQITFGKNEVIENIQNGDLDAWTVNVQKGLSNMLFIKPTILDSDTNMTVITNKHTYFFHLMSNKDDTAPQDDITYAIEFIYPNETRARMLANLKYNAQHKKTMVAAKEHSKHFNWDYSFSGADFVMPLKVFDDGKFTFMQFRAHQSLPAIFAVDNRAGKEAVVNYRKDGKYIVIQEIAPQFTLRDGQYNVASIFNNKLIHKLQQDD